MRLEESTGQALNPVQKRGILLGSPVYCLTSSNVLDGLALEPPVRENIWISTLEGALLNITDLLFGLELRFFS